MLADTHLAQMNEQADHKMNHATIQDAQCNQHDSCDFQCCSGCPSATTALDYTPSGIAISATSLNLLFTRHLLDSIALPLRERPPRLNG